MGATVHVDEDPQVPEAPIIVSVPVLMTAQADEDVTFWLTVDEARQLATDLTSAVMHGGRR
jgi:hypothetical protein